MKKYKSIRMIISIFAVILLLTACSAPSSTSSGSTGDSSGSASESQLEAVTLSWYSSVNKKAPGEPEMADAVNSYLQEKLNVTVDFHLYELADYKTAVPTMITSGQEMDIVYSGNGAINGYVTTANQNAFVALDDYIDQYLPKTKALVSQATWEAVRVNGKIYAIPPLKDLAANWGFLVNQDMLDDLGVLFPEKFDTAADLIPFFYEVKQARDAKYPEKAENPVLGSAPSRMDQWYYYEVINGLACVNIPGLTNLAGKGDGETVFNLYETDEYRQMMKTVRQLVVDGVVPFDGTSFDPDKVLFNAGELLGAYPQGYIYVDEDMNAPYYKTTLHQAQNSIMTTSYVQATLQSISHTSKHVERSLMLLELVNTDPYLATILRFGPEGENWTDEDNDNILEFTEKNSDSANRAWYEWYGQWGNITISKYPEGYPANFGDLVKELNDSSNQESNLGFIFDTASVQNEIAACNNVISEYDEVLKKGQSDDVDGLIDTFVQKLRDNGSEKIVEEAQRQLTEWRASVGKSVQ